MPKNKAYKKGKIGHNNESDESGDIVYENDGAESGDRDHSSDLTDKIRRIKAELKACKSEKQEYLDGWQRAKADFVNFKKRSEEERREFAKFANEEFIMELLPVLDSFEQAFRDKKNWEKASLDWRMGIEFIYSQLRTVLENHGVTEMNPLGETFDPVLHHSIEAQKVDDPADNDKIVGVTQKGYRIGEKIIRYPSVRVGESKS